MRKIGRRVDETKIDSHIWNENTHFSFDAFLKRNRFHSVEVKSERLSN